MSATSLDAARAVAQRVLDRFPELWPSDLKYFVPDGEVAAGPLYVFRWKQQFDGLDVRGGMIQIQVHRTGRVVAISCAGASFPEGFSRMPAIGADEAERRVASLKQPRAGDTIVAKDILIFNKSAGGTSAPRVAWQVDVEQPWAGQFERVYVDAGDGTILEVEPLRREIDVTGKVTGFANVSQSGLAAPVEVPIPGVTVTVPNVGTGVTDQNGVYFISKPGATSNTVKIALSGPDYFIQNAQGTNYTMDISGATPIGGVITANFVMNATPTEFDTAQITAAYQVERVLKYIKTEVPSYNHWPSMFTQVNINSTCNAYYTGGTINFYNAGGGCVNTAYSSVVHHEFGHGVDDSFGGIWSGSLSEALADIVAMYISQQPIVGQDFKGPGTMVRTGENTVSWPASACGGEVHCVGQTFMGFAWQAWKKLKTSLGDAQGADVAESVFLGTFPVNNTSILDAVTQVFLLDDDDGDITNGSPHYTDLAAAAVMKGFTPPQLKPIIVTHVPHPDTWNQTQPYAVICDVAFNASTPMSVDLEYTVEGSSPVTVPMAPFAQPGRYMATIPPVVAPKFINYQIRAIDNAFNVQTQPPGDDAYRFGVGRKTVFLQENFDTGAPGWLHGAAAGTDDWEIGSPQSGGTNLYDPKKAASGAYCAGNDLQLVFGSNGLYDNASDRTLQSPPVDASSHTGVRVRYRRWLSVEAAQFDLAEVKVNNSAVFANPYSSYLFDSSWTLQDHPAPAADQTNGFRAEWRLKSDPGVAYGGWNIDDVSIYALESTPVTNITLSTATPNPYMGNFFNINLAGTPNANWELFVSVFPGSTTLEGFGVIPVAPEYLSWFGSGTLDGAGNGSFGFPMPYIGGLQGFSFYWVAGAIQPGGNWQISNVLKVTWQ
jgi:hypothetical protein